MTAISHAKFSWNNNLIIIQILVLYIAEGLSESTLKLDQTMD